MTMSAFDDHQTEQNTRFALNRIESRIVWLTQELQRAEGIRDRLLRDLQDLEGSAAGNDPQAIEYR
jgi:hypothetical protein